MAGIYIHIPFCKQACHYCDFHFSTNTKLRDEMVDAICQEISLRHEYLASTDLSSIYFGGGTPSLLEQKHIEQILSRLSKYYSWSEHIEITLEANPDDLNDAYIKELVASGINRLSIGIQSFIDEELEACNRAHNAQESLTAVQKAQDAGIENMSIDLIYGMPKSTIDSWKYNVAQAVKLNVDHISSYALTVEPKTALAHMVKKGKVTMPADNNTSQQYLYLIQQLRDAGYEHYEISNFARNQRYAQHNTSYWQSKSYLGLGPSAHSYQPGTRHWNIANNAIYIRQINQQILPLETEALSALDEYNEFIMTRLRTMWGVSSNELSERFPQWLSSFERGIAPYISSGYVLREGASYRLTDEGKLLADGIASELFVVE